MVNTVYSWKIIFVLNFEGVPVVPLLNFKGALGPTFKLYGGPGSHFKLWRGSQVPMSRVRDSWSHFYTMPMWDRRKIFANIARGNVQ